VNGLYGQVAARNVEVDYHTDEESAYNPNVHILTTKHVKEVDMRKRNAMSSVVQVRKAPT